MSSPAHRNPTNRSNIIVGSRGQSIPPSSYQSSFGGNLLGLQTAPVSIGRQEPSSVTPTQRTSLFRSNMFTNRRASPSPLSASVDESSPHKKPWKQPPLVPLTYSHTNQQQL